jgi:hypothetical protein
MKKINSYPLPTGERIKGEGETSRIISTLTLALSRQRERGTNRIFSTISEIDER